MQFRIISLTISRQRTSLPTQPGISRRMRTIIPGAANCSSPMVTRITTSSPAKNATPRAAWITSVHGIYSNSTGRFLTPDWSSVPVPVPYADLTNPQTLNQYIFAHNNPTSLDDPDGHCPDGPCVVFEETGVIVAEEAPAVLGTTTGTATATATVTAEGATATGTTIAEEAVETGGGRTVVGFLGKAFGVVGGVLGSPLELNHGEQEWINKQKQIQAQRQKEQAAAEEAEAGHDRNKRRSTKDKHEKRRPGTPPPPNYKPYRKHERSKEDKKKDKEKKPYHRKDRDPKPNEQQ